MLLAQNISMINTNYNLYDPYTCYMYMGMVKGNQSVSHLDTFELLKYSTSSWLFFHAL